jgi:hypothetical protein
LLAHLPSSSLRQGVPPSLRGYELLSVTVGQSSAKFDRRSNYVFQSYLHLGRIIFLSAMLGAGVLTFSRDADRLVLQPIERMMRMVEEIADNPLNALRDSRGSLRGGATLVSVGGKRGSGGTSAAKAEAENYETRLLEQSISKICSLMALGFGDAGSEIIGENMRNGGALNPMVPGKKKCAIFGFCDIRHFTDATEVLQEEVLLLECFPLRSRRRCCGSIFRQA